MKWIELTQGKATVVDDNIFEYLSQWKWFAHKNTTRGVYYAVRNSTDKTTKKRKTISMHRVIMEMNIHRSMTCKEQIDHIDLDGLNNAIENLRIATQSQNTANRLTFTFKKSSQYKGVYWSKKKRLWVTKLKVEGKEIFIGHFRQEENAAMAYDDAAIRYFGEFAKTNFQKTRRSYLAHVPRLGV
jgi:hypothetical protein